jgi:hypothetical protein
MSKGEKGGADTSRWQWLKDAFSMEAGYEPLTERELLLLDRMASFIVCRRLQMPAILMLESVKPLNYVGSQAMAFFEPVIRALFNAAEYSEVRVILERRQSIETLIRKIEEKEDEPVRGEAEAKGSRDRGTST